MKFNMVGSLSRCLLLAYRTPAESVRSLLPVGLELMTRGPWAFWNVVVCRVEKMRPTGLPRCCGLSYHHVAYRLYITAKTAAGKDMQGLYFLRSDVDSGTVCRGGNLATDFHFNRASIDITSHDGVEAIGITGTRGGKGDAMLRVRSVSDYPPVEDTCFADISEARTVLKYRPLGLSVLKDTRWLRVAEVFREESQWREAPVAVEAARWTYFEDLHQNDLALELATQVAPIDYRWRLGRRERMKC
ncbi:MAG: DUF2071 domain-containing protein [Phycisphaeraceae bacterium]